MTALDKQITEMMKHVESTAKGIEADEVAAVGMIKLMTARIESSALDPEAIKQVTAELTAARQKLQKAIKANRIQGKRKGKTPCSVN